MSTKDSSGMQKLVEESGAVMFLRYWSFQVAVHTCLKNMLRTLPNEQIWKLRLAFCLVGTSIPLVNQSSLTGMGVCSLIKLNASMCVCAGAKGHLISKCPYEKSVWTKIATKIFPRFLFLKFTTSRLTQKESLCSVCKKIDSIL